MDDQEESAAVSKSAGPVAENDPRVILAAERTLLAWIRTGLAMMGFGFLVVKFGLFLSEVAILQGVEPADDHSSANSARRSCRVSGWRSRRTTTATCRSISVSLTALIRWVSSSTTTPSN